jgi:hypothetical protein
MSKIQCIVHSFIHSCQNKSEVWSPSKQVKKKRQSHACSRSTYAKKRRGIQTIARKDKQTREVNEEEYQGEKHNQIKHHKQEISVKNKSNARKADCWKLHR